jgi:glucosamine kinase
MSHLALVDGGGTKTLVRLVQLETEGVVAETRVGPGNLSEGADQVWARIEEALRTFPVPADYILAGLAGSEYHLYRDQFLADAPMPTELVSDRDSGLVGAHAGKPGVCLTVGTGVALAWMDQTGRVECRGGFGFLLGDQGGGAWLGHQCMRHLLPALAHRALDADGEALRVACGLSKQASDWMVFADQATPATFAALSEPIVEAANAGNQIARRLIETGTDALHELLTLAPSNLPVAAVGGLATVYGPLLQQRGLPMRQPQGDALDGLMSIWRGTSGLAIERWSSHA